jgi:hypothetical protein
MPRFKVNFPNYYIVDAQDESEALKIAIQLSDLFSLNEIPVAHNDAAIIEKIDIVLEEESDNHYFEDSFKKWKAECNIPVGWIEDKMDRNNLYSVFLKWLDHPTLEPGEFFEIPEAEEPTVQLTELTSDDLDVIVEEMLKEFPAKKWTRDAVADYCFKRSIAYYYGRFLYARIKNKL